MFTQQLTIFDSVKDELAFYSGEENIAIYQSKKRILYRGEELFFYAIKQLYNSEWEEPISVKELYDDHETCLELTSCSTTDLLRDKILILAKNVDACQLPSDVHIWKFSSIENFSVLEIDIENSYLADYPKYFSNSLDVKMCEIFERLSFEDLLDFSF